MTDSDKLGYNDGMDAADNALWVAAADGGFVMGLVLLEEREGLTSCELFFRGRPGPAGRFGLEVVDLRFGRTGEDSREGIGEFVVDGARFGCSFFVVRVDDVEESRWPGLGVVERFCSIEEATPVSIGSPRAGSCIAVDMLFSDDISCLFVFYKRRSSAPAGTLIAPQTKRANEPDKWDWVPGLGLSGPSSAVV